MKSFFNKILILIITIITMNFDAYCQIEFQCQNPWPTCTDLMNIFPKDNNNIFISGGSGTILFTNNGGISWEDKSLPTTSYGKKIFFLDALTGFYLSSSNIFTTNDAGDTWEEMYPGIDLTNYFYSNLEFIDKTNGWVTTSASSTYFQNILDNPGKVFKTSDGGKTWCEVLGDFRGKLLNIFCLDENNIFIYSSEVITQFDIRSYLYKTTDGGISWQKYELPIETGGGIFFINKNTGWVGKFKTSDGGISWESNLESSLSIKGVRFFNDNTGLIYNDTTVFTTDDSGITWQKSDLKAGTKLMNVNFLDQNFGWACGLGGNIYSTANGGKNWNRISRGIINSLYDVDIIDKKNSWAVGGKALYTEDGGKNWIEKKISKYFLRAVDFIDYKMGWIAGDESIYRTQDGGLTWDSTHFENKTFLDIQFVNERIGYAVGSTGTILKTEDGGKTWGQQNSGITNTLTKVQFVDSLYGWVCGIYSIILKTTDGGLNWELNILDSALQLALNELQFIDRTHGWISSSAEEAFFRTTDGGINWLPTPLENIPIAGINTFYFRDKIHGLASSILLSDIAETSDGGESWKFIKKLPSQKINSIKIQGYHGYAVGYYGAIYQIRIDTNITAIKKNPTNEKNYLFTNYPNPFNNQTNICFTLPSPQKVKIVAFNVIGEKIKEIFYDGLLQGKNIIEWNARDLPSGIYLIKISCNEFTQIHKCILIK